MSLDIDESKLRVALSPETECKPCNQISRAKAIRRSIKRTCSNIIWLSRSVRIFQFDLVLIDGKEKHSGQSVKTLYIGETEPPIVKLGKLYSKSEAVEKYDNFRFIIDSIYSDYTIIAQTKNINGLKICRELKKFEAQTDMVFIDAELLFVQMLERDRYLALPQWVSLKLNIPDRWEDVIKSFPKDLRKKLNRIFKKGYQYYIANTNNVFHYFYYAMYVPYTQTRFGDAAILYSPEQIRKVLQQGEILLVFRDDLVLLGSLNKYENERLLLICAASADDIQPEMFKGASEAMDYFSILSAFEKGCHVVDFLGSRPLLDDGAFRYKRKWGAHIDELHLPLTDIYFRPVNLNTGVKSYLACNPLIIKTPDGFRGRILLNQPVGDKDIQNCANRYKTKGMNGIDVFCTGGIKNDRQIGDDEKCSQIKVYNIGNSRHPERDFCKL